MPSEDGNDGAVEAAIDTASRADGLPAGAPIQDPLVPVTNFFRDRDAFAALETHIPHLFHSKRSRDTVRVWVAACASGEEAYSVAMLLHEHARRLPSAPGVQVFATDVSEEAIRHARDGVYPATSATDVSAERLAHFFVKEHRGYRVRRELRETVLFARHDLLRDTPFSKLDLVTCRHLLSSLSRDARRRALDIFHFSLVRQGLLFLGTSESKDDAGELFAPLDQKHRLYTARPAAKTGLLLSVGPGTLARTLREQEPSAGQAGPPVAAGPILSEQATTSELHLRALAQAGPAVLIVNGQHEVVHLSGAAGRYLQFGGGEMTHHLFQIVHPILRPELRAALSRAAQTQQAVEVPGLPVEVDGQPQVVDLRVSPARDAAPDLLVISFHPRPIAPSSAVGADDSAGRDPATGQLAGELERLEGHLRHVQEQHEVTVEEHRAGHEELQSMNEELRSASEELETSREELQSINEELTTVNQELKARVDELGRSNGDLHNLMAATNIATLFLDRELRVTRYTPSAVALFNLIPTDVGRPLTDLRHRLDYPELETDSRRVLADLALVGREVPKHGNGWFLVRLQPYRTMDDHPAGVVLTFVDISEHKRAEAALRESEELRRIALEGGRMGTWRWDLQSRLIWGDAEFLALWGFAPTSQSFPLALFTDRMSPESRAATEAVVTKATEQREEFDGQVEVAGGPTAGQWIRWRGQAEQDKPWLLNGVSFNVTEQRRAEEHRRASEGRQAFLLRLSDALHSLDDPLGIQEAAMRLLGEHLRATRAFYFFTEPADGGDWIHVIETDYRRDPAMPSHAGRHSVKTFGLRLFEGAEHGRVVAVEDVTKVALLTAAEVQKYLSVEVTAFINVPLIKAGRFIGGIGAHDSVPRPWKPDEIDLIREVAARTWASIERARAEQSLRESEEDLQAANRAKDHFLAVLSHELRTPLMPITMALAALGQRPDLPEFVRKAHAMIQRNVELEAHFINDLLDVTRIVRGKLEIEQKDMDLHEALERAMEVSSADVEAKEQRLTVNLEAREHRLAGDFARLQQAVWNLLKNASKFTPRAGEITLRTHHEPGRIVVTVTDTGIGLEAEALARVFRPFEQADATITREYGGLGLGLAIAKGTVEAHGGTLHASSPGRGQGATFTVSLPLSAPAGETDRSASGGPRQ